MVFFPPSLAVADTSSREKPPCSELMRPHFSFPLQDPLGHLQPLEPAVRHSPICTFQLAGAVGSILWQVGVGTSGTT